MYHEKALFVTQLCGYTYDILKTYSTSLINNRYSASVMTEPAEYRNTHHENNPRSLAIKDFGTCGRLLACSKALVPFTVWSPLSISFWIRTLTHVCDIFPMIRHADSYVFSKRSILHPSAIISCQKSLFSCSSRRFPISSLTSLHIVVAITTFGMAFWPHKFANNVRFFSDVPAIRLSEILCK